MKVALITGITGQDGAYLAKFLLGKGYKVFGTYRRLSTPNFWRLHYLDVYDKITLISADIMDARSISEALKKSNPDEIYHLAAQSFVGASFDQPLYTSDITGFGTVRLLEEVKKYNQEIKIYQASSSEMYGNVKTKLKNEDTPFHPSSPYAIAKLYSYWMINLYREAYGIHASNGILFNHESPIRGLEFVTRKISNGVAKISLGLSDNLKLGNLEAKRDWGYAPEYVEGMWMILQQKRPSDYVLATNESHTVKDLVDEACRVAGVSSSKIISSKVNFRPFDVLDLKGDYLKAKKKLGWKPNTTFKKLVKIMVEEDIIRWQRWLKGEHFPWDAATSGDDSHIVMRNKTQF
ncbi:MAG: GDP-mannose 4,6-dehydratase [Thaumarchaeota archaeon]|nr:GDP-mannose 4,6-dehydratase [Nitrososphaerota archaeon]